MTFSVSLGASECAHTYIYEAMYKNDVIKNLIEKIQKVISFVLENIAVMAASGLSVASVFYIGGSSAGLECLGYCAVNGICLLVFWGICKLDNETPIDTIIRKFNLLSDLSN